MNGDLPALFHWTKLLIIPSVLLAYTVHELGHALTAYYLGDYSQVERGKITLNPLEHTPWFGTLAFILFGIGWPKPLQVNPYNFKRKYLGLFMVAVSGPLATLTLSVAGFLLTAAIWAALVYLTDASTEDVAYYLFPSPSYRPATPDIQAWSIALTGHIALTSFLLTLISLLPLPGLDGFVAATSLIAFFRQPPGQPQTKASPSQQQQFLESALVDGSPLLLSQQSRRNSAADIHFKVGTEYHQQNQYDDAIARYRQAIRNDQYCGPAYVNMGLAYLAKKEKKKAIQAFRGATLYADDKRSQTEAWYQLHKLSEISPVNEKEAQKSMVEIGDSPWTDTKPRPNWLGLIVTTTIVVVGGLFIYSYLFAQLLEVLTA